MQKIYINRMNTNTLHLLRSTVELMELWMQVILSDMNIIFEAL